MFVPQPACHSGSGCPALGGLSANSSLARYLGRIIVALGASNTGCHIVASNATGDVHMWPDQACCVIG